MPRIEYLLSVTGSPVFRSADSTVLTLAPGTACLITPQAPATCGAAIDVPLSAWYDPPGTDDVIDSPGASSERNGATFENHDTASVLSVEPTLTADEMQACVVRPDGDAELPAATTVAIPIARRLSMMGLAGSVSHGALKTLPPRLMFTEAMFCCPASATAYTCSRPAMMSDVNAPAHGATPPQLAASVTRENTWTAINVAPLATPGGCWGFVESWPAAMPATCVPWMQSPSEHGTAEPGPVCTARPFGQNDALVPATMLE